MDWKKYENEIIAILTESYPQFHILKDQRLEGKYSKKKRQIDILIKSKIAGHEITIIVDCKYFNKRIDVKTVESFISMTSDVSAHKGLLITNKGYSTAALKRAFNDPNDVELDIINFDEFKQYQGPIGIPFVGENGVIVLAPMGWVVDARSTQGFAASMYRRGSDLDKAVKSFEFAYITFNTKNSSEISINNLITKEIEKIKSLVDKNSKHESFDFTEKANFESKIRISNIPNYNGNEIAGYVDFGEYIFCIYLLTDYLTFARNKRRIERVLETVHPIKLRILKK